MARKRTLDQTARIVEAALSQTAKTGWSSLTIEAVAKKAKLKTADVSGLFPDPWKILLHILKKMDGEVETAVKNNLSGTWRDDLFEILMARFDAMEKHRAAFTSLPLDVFKMPKAAPHFIQPFYRSIHGMLTLAGAPSSPPYVAVFSTLYFMILEDWKSDVSPDHTKTMAAVDRRLGQFERALGICAKIC